MCFSWYKNNPSHVKGLKTEWDIIFYFFRSSTLFTYLLYQNSFIISEQSVLGKMSYKVHFKRIDFLFGEDIGLLAGSKGLVGDARGHL